MILSTDLAKGVKLDARIGKYTLIDRYAVGGAAEIFRAKTDERGDIVVIKRMRPETIHDSLLREGFHRETWLSTLFHHPNLVEGYEKDQMNGVDYVVLEYVPGVDLRSLLDRVRERQVPVPLAFWLHVVHQILLALEFAHDLKDEENIPLGLVHRDVHPGNILINFQGKVKLADFGVAHLARIDPMPEHVVGTPGYLAPEQAKRLELDQRTDLFSLGCVLYEILTRERAFDIHDLSDEKILKIHQKGAIKKVPRSVPEDLRMVVEIACSPEPDDRYASARSMLRDLDEALSDTGVYGPDLGLATVARQLFPDLFQKSIVAEP